MNETSRRPAFDSGSRAASLLLPLSVLAMVFAANCGGGGGQSNPPLPNVVIEAEDDLVDVGERFFFDASESTDPNGDAEDLEFLWRIAEGGNDDTRFDDHCRDDFDIICFSNDDDTCSNDDTRICNSDEDCLNLGTCNFNSGTTSPDCPTGICGLFEGDEGEQATLVANVAGPFEIRVTAIGSESNGVGTRTFDTFPSLYVLNSIYQFGGTGGAFLGELEDADEFAEEASEGASDPNTGNLVVIDEDLGVVRVFDLQTGEIVGAFGESDRFVNNPAAIAFHPDSARLYIAEQGGRVLIFEAESGLLVGEFVNVGVGPVAMRFTPDGDSLLVVYGNPGTGVREFDEDGTALGVLGDTDTAVSEAVDLDFLDDDLLIADATGRVVRCDSDGEDCGPFSAELDALLADGAPTAIAVNPSANFTDNDVLVTDPIEQRVIACEDDGDSCETFGETDDSEVQSDYLDLFFSPGTTPTTTTSTSTTTTTTLP